MFILPKFKKRNLALILTGLISANALALEIDAKLKTSYDSNPFLLSDSDQDKFDDGDEKFSYIETRDDVVAKGSLTATQPIFKRKKFRTRINTEARIGFEQYMKNTDKSRADFRGAIRLDTRKLDLKLSYLYSPNHYIRQYDDKDATKELEKYIYDKNSSKISGSYRVMKPLYVLFSYAFEQDFYNEYFTEYDADRSVISGGLRYSFPKFYLTGNYVYTIHNNDDIDLDNLSLGDYVRDASYESNTYKLALKFKKIKIARKKHIRPNANFSYDQRFYQTNLSVDYDEIHSGRQDDTTKFGLGCDFYFYKNLDISLDYQRTYRKVEADYENLSKTKDYSRDMIGLSFTYHWKLK